MTDNLHASYDPAEEPADPNREGRDRRSQPTPMLSRHTLTGRRTGNRRESDTDTSYYVDRFGRSSWLALATVVTLCILDGVLTVWHLKEGGSELNPAMATLINTLGNGYFLLVKYAITAGGMFFLILHKNFRGVKFLIRFLVAVYVLLILYHFLVIAVRTA